MATDATPPENLKCPHCLVVCFMPRSPRVWPLGHDSDGHWWVENRTCPNCGKVVVWLGCSTESNSNHPGILYPWGSQQWMFVRPKASGRPPVPSEVLEEFAEDYREACLVIADSPKASAALSRRCLQHILREKAQVKTQTTWLSLSRRSSMAAAYLPMSLTPSTLSATLETSLPTLIKV